MGKPIAITATPRSCYAFTTTASPTTQALVVATTSPINFCSSRPTKEEQDLCQTARRKFDADMKSGKLVYNKGIDLWIFEIPPSYTYTGVKKGETYGNIKERYGITSSKGVFDEANNLGGNKDSYTPIGPRVNISRAGLLEQAVGLKK